MYAFEVYVGQNIDVMSDVSHGPFYEDSLLIKQSCFVNYFNNWKISIKMSNNSSFMSNDKNRTIVNSGLTWILVINKMWF